MILGEVIDTFSAKKGYKGSVRPKTNFLEMIKNHGIKDDKFANKDIERSVMIVGKIAYDIAKQNGIDLEFGSLGENILLNFNPHTLNIGDIIVVDKVQLQITEECSICSHLSVHNKILPSLIEKHRGVYCKIVTDGIIKKGDNICKL